MIQCNKLNAGERSTKKLRQELRRTKTAMEWELWIKQPLCACKCAKRGGRDNDFAGRAQQQQKLKKNCEFRLRQMNKILKLFGSVCTCSIGGVDSDEFHNDVICIVCHSFLSFQQHIHFALDISFSVVYVCVCHLPLLLVYLEKCSIMFCSLFIWFHFDLVAFNVF